MIHLLGSKMVRHEQTSIGVSARLQTRKVLYFKIGKMTEKILALGSHSTYYLLFFIALV